MVGLELRTILLNPDGLNTDEFINYRNGVKKAQSMYSVPSGQSYD
jgi:hypothetical protein